MKASRIGFNPIYSEDEPVYEDVSALPGRAILEFGAPWCGHCKAAQNAIESVLQATDMVHIKIYDGKGRPLGRAFGVKLWPTLILLDDGQEVRRVVRPKQISDIRQLIVNEQ